MSDAQIFEVWNRTGWCNVDVVGEYYHSKEIRKLYPKQIQHGDREIRSRAVLEPEPTNRHDRHAVKVIVKGRLVGYLPRELAPDYAGVLAGLRAQGLSPTTDCRIYAYESQEWTGTDRRGRDKYEEVFHSDVSVALDEPHLIVPLNRPPEGAYRLVPMGNALQLKGEEEHLDVLAPLVSAHGEGWVYATLHPETTGTGKTEREVVGLRIDGRPVGRLTPAMSAHYLPTIAHLQAGGFSTAARLLVKGNQLKVEAVLHAAKAHELDAAWLNAVPAVQAPPAPAARNFEEGGATANVLASPAIERPTADVVLPPRPTRIVFNPPPGWPPAPGDFNPPPGWRPPPEWPRPPDGWEFWVGR